MCGICGIVGLSAELGTHTTLIDRARDSLIHRGPDDAGTYQAPNGRVALAMRRLAIVDLTDCGHQPMHRQVGEAVATLVFNGEIYNHNELRRELAGYGHGFRGHSDTEVVLAAYLQWGPDCLSRFVGMFAIALHDPRSDVLFLARDRAGEKPLYYVHTPNRLSFASELKALMEDDVLPRRIDARALNHYLAFGYTPGGQSMLEGVCKLPAAHALLYHLRTDELKVWRYWQLPTSRPAEAPVDELSAELERLLEDSVRGQMQADVPVAVMLSGGIDSSLVAALAARTTNDVRTYTITMPTKDHHNEGPTARRIASYFGTRHTELQAEPASVELLPVLARQFDEPNGDSGMVPTYLLSRLIESRAKVALGGDGGDELFGGYPHHRWAVRQESLRRLGAPMRIAAEAASSFMPLGARGKNFVVALTSDLETAAGKSGQYFDVDWRQRISPLLRNFDAAALNAPELERAGLAVSPATTIQKVTAVDFATYMCEDILAKVDRASMLTSLEVRAPFLDHRVIEFAFSRVPDHLKTTASQGKILSRQLAARLMPPELISPRKQGFSIPLHAWFQGEWGSYMEDILRGAPTELLDPLAVKRVIELQREGRSNSHRIFTLVMLELWRREYKVSLPG